MGKRRKNKNKNKLPVFDSDDDFLKEFEEKKYPEKKYRGKKNKSPEDMLSKDKHGVHVLDSQLSDDNFDKTEDEVDFATLLEESFKNKITKKVKMTSKPVPLKKRLKRYPPVELDLDLHGFTAIGAQVKTRSFINSCKQRGFFTIRVIVGKGLHSELGAVLPDVVEDVVKEMKQQGQVLSFEWEGKKDPTPVL